MRQVPAVIPYAIIGNGKMASHFCHYLTLLNIPYLHWHRQLSLPLSAFMEQAEHCERILVLISDRAIEPLIQSYPHIHREKWVHFSGSLVTPYAKSAHPLYTFGPELYDLNTYRAIPFILEEGGAPIEKLLPFLPNPHYSIKPELKPLYHSMCVLANNFSSLLWEKLFSTFENQLNLPRQCAFPYLAQTRTNIQTLGKQALTGPLIRKDKQTISANLSALENDPYHEIYSAFVSAFQKTAAV